MNRDNLKKLADYLLSGNLKSEFNMLHYADENNNGSNEIGKLTCGVVGCAVGHGPYAGIEKHSYECWDSYVIRVFGAESAMFSWCFSSDWTGVDNTPEGAAKRILYTLEHGVPLDYYEQQRGDAPLCYT